jgi:hypothetical protein
MPVGKLILVKRDDIYCRLIPVTALQIDGASGTVVIDRAVNMDDDGETNMIPRERCFEFDADLMETVNSLVQAAMDKLTAAGQVCATGLLPAEFETDRPAGEPITH